jgi:hypothetical protein
LRPHHNDMRRMRAEALPSGNEKMIRMWGVRWTAECKGTARQTRRHWQAKRALLVICFLTSKFFAEVFCEPAALSWDIILVIGICKRPLRPVLVSVVRRKVQLPAVRLRKAISAWPSAAEMAVMWTKLVSGMMPPPRRFSAQCRTQARIWLRT